MRFLRFSPKQAASTSAECDSTLTRLSITGCASKGGRDPGRAGAAPVRRLQESVQKSCEGPTFHARGLWFGKLARRASPHLQRWPLGDFSSLSSPRRRVFLYGVILNTPISLANFLEPRAFGGALSYRALPCAAGGCAEQLRTSGAAAARGRPLGEGRRYVQVSTCKPKKRCETQSTQSSNGCPERCGFACMSFHFVRGSLLCIDDVTS